MTITLEPIGTVTSDRTDPEDDFWGGRTSTITLDARFGADALKGLDGFSHAEIIFIFDQVDPLHVTTGARHPRHNPAWPLTGIFAQRGKNRPNRIGSTICRVISVDGHRLVVGELDAIDGTPVVDIKPVIKEFLPRGDVRQPAWCSELMADYWANR